MMKQTCTHSLGCQDVGTERGRDVILIGLLKQPLASTKQTKETFKIQSISLFPYEDR